MKFTCSFTMGSRFGRWSIYKEVKFLKPDFLKIYTITGKTTSGWKMIFAFTELEIRQAASDFCKTR